MKRIRQIMRKNINQNKKYPVLSKALVRAQKAIGKPFYKMALDKDSFKDKKTINKLKKNIKSKSLFGRLLEDWFDKRSDNSTAPDIQNKQYSLELKTTAYIKEKTSSRYQNPYRIKDRLVFDLIDYKELKNRPIRSTKFYKKAQNILLAFYQHHSHTYNSKKMYFKNIVLFNLFGNKTSNYVQKYVRNALNNPKVNITKIAPSKNDEALILGDWLTLKDEVQKNIPIHETDTALLDPCEKGEKKQRSSKFPTQIQRAYALKVSYMDYLTNYYNVFGTSTLNKPQIRSIFNKNTQNYIKKHNLNLPVQPISLTKFIHNIIQAYAGKSNKSIAKSFGIKYKNHAKNFNYQLISRMFGLSTNGNTNTGISRSKEFIKSGIIPKTIEFGVKSNGHANASQAMSFPTFSYKDFHTTWKNSKLYDELFNHTFFFCVFEDEHHTSSNASPLASTFKGAFLYNFSGLNYNDKSKIASVWLDTKYKLLKGGVVLTPKYNKYKSCNKILTDLTPSSANRIIHVRSHANKSSYIKNDSNSFCVPAGLIWVSKPKAVYSNNYMTKQCFWINKNFINKICRNNGLVK